MWSHAIFTFFAYTHWVVQMKVCKFSSFNVFMGPLCGMLPTPQDLMPKTYKSWLEINRTKGGFHISNFPLASDWRWSHSTWAFAWAWRILGNFVIGLHAHHLKCMHSFEHGLNNVDTFHKSRDNQICFFLPWGHAFSWGVRWVTTWWHMQWNMCQFFTPTLTPT
jgi:hypothetical protein